VGLRLAVGVHDAADVRQQLRVLLFALGLAPLGQIIDANDARPHLLESEFDRPTPPTKHLFGRAGLAVQ